MNSQAASNLIAAPRSALVHVVNGQALRLGRFGGALSVVAGSVWLTRHGDLDDHVLERGATFSVRAADHAVIEALAPGVTATVLWRPTPQRISTSFFAAPLRALAFLADRAASRLASLSRHAAASAWRAQGCMAAGRSVAPSAALKSPC